MFRTSRLVVFALTSVLLWAQFGASLQGTVTDSNGAVVPNANLTLINSETRQKMTGTTTGEGSYRFTSLAPGAYSLKVEAPGFKSSVLNVQVQAEQSQQGIHRELSELIPPPGTTQWICGWRWRF